MKPNKLLFGVALAGALAFGATAFAKTSPKYPLVTISLSGTVHYSPNYDDELSQEVPLKTVSYNTKTLIAMLNASSYATNKIHGVTGTNQIPTGSYFLWAPYEEELFLTNKNGFFFPLEGSGYDMGYLEVDEDHLIGTYSLNSVLAGTETDKTGIYFYFYDGAYYENEIETSGTATLNWTYGAASGGAQKATVSVAMSANSDEESYIYDYDAVSASFSASGSGSLTNESTNSVPFFYKY